MTHLFSAPSADGAERAVWVVTQRQREREGLSLSPGFTQRERDRLPAESDRLGAEKERETLGVERERGTLGAKSERDRL